jgi:hypothetical protein
MKQEDKIQIRFVDGECKAFLRGVELKLAQRRPHRLPPQIDFTCVVCQEPREEGRRSGDGPSAKLVCVYCVNYARGVGYNLNISRGDLYVMRRLAAITDQLSHEARHARAR